MEKLMNENGKWSLAKHKQGEWNSGLRHAINKAKNTPLPYAGLTLQKKQESIRIMEESGEGIKLRNRIDELLENANSASSEIEKHRVDSHTLYISPMLLGLCRGMMQTWLREVKHILPMLNKHENRLEALKKQVEVLGSMAAPQN